MCGSIPAASIPPGKSPGKPQAFEKDRSNTRPCGYFLEPPVPTWWSNARSPVQPTNIKILVAIFNKNNCFIELHKTGHEMSHSDCKKDKANGFIAFISLLWSINALLIPKWPCLKLLTLSVVGNEDRMLRNKIFAVCKFPGGGALLNSKCPAPETHRASNAWGFPGRGCWRLKLARTLIVPVRIMLLSVR